jgi:hypothetical protein
MVQGGAAGLPPLFAETFLGLPMKAEFPAGASAKRAAIPAPNRSVLPKTMVQSEGGQEEKKGGSISTGCLMALPLSGVLFIPLFTELPPEALSPVSAMPLRIRTGATFFAVPMPKFLA